MPIEKYLVDSILNPFRAMVKDVEDQKLTGEAVSNMSRILQTMERLAQEMSDLASYSTKLSTDNLYLDFSNNYSKALAAAAASKTSGKMQDDAALLKQTVSQYEIRLKMLKKDPESLDLWPPLEKVIQIGKSGVSYPIFLKTCEEQGLFETINAGNPRPVIEFDLHVATVMFDPVRKEMYEKLLKAHDTLAKKHPLGLVDPVELEMLRFRIQHEYEPKINRWEAIVFRSGKLIDIVIDWLDSFTSFAPFDERWADPTGPARTKENIAFTQECGPGIFKVRENIFQEYFDFTWNDIFTHETYRNEVAAARIWYSDERIALAKKTYSHMQPGKGPPKELITESETLRKENRLRNKANLERYGEGKKPEEIFNFKKFSEFVRAKKL